MCTSCINSTSSTVVTLKGAKQYSVLYTADSLCGKRIQNGEHDTDAEKNARLVFVAFGGINHFGV